MRRFDRFWAPVLAAGLVVSAGASAAAPKVPEKTDKALRARVNEFFQYHVTGEFRKAMEMVAEDTKEEYFAAGKMKLRSFTLDDVKYDDKFEKATVTCTVVRDWEFRLQVNTVTLPMVTTWKLEKGKWVWYHKPEGQEWLTPMGPSDLSAIKRNADGTITLPKLTQENVLAQAANIMKANGVDKGDVRFDAGMPGSDKITFHNGQPGSVRLELLSMPPVPGLTYKFDKVDLNGGESAVLSVDYQPVEGKEMPREAKILFEIQPFNSTYTIAVHFEKAPQ